MSYKVEGKIESISEIETNDYGSKLTCTLKNDEQYNNLYIFEYFNKDASYLEKFKEYNKEGDSVEIEFNVNCRKGISKADKPYEITKLSLWRCNKIGGNSSNDNSSSAEDDSDSLPF